MFIHSIELTNFRNLKGKHFFEFKKGVNLFYGGNFAGKSSVHKAIALCLNINDNDNKNLEEYINDHCDYFDITLTFSHGGKEFKEYVSYNKSKESKRELYINGSETPSFNTASSVKEELSKIIDPVLGEHALFMMQDSLSIISAKDSERLELFKKIRNLNFKKQADELDAQIKKIKEEDLKGIEIKLISLDEKEYNPTILKDDLLTKEEILSKKDELSKIEVRILEVKNEKEKLDALISSHNEVDIALQNEERNISDIEENIKKKENYTTEVTNSTSMEIAEIDKAIETLKEEIKKEFDDSDIMEAKEQSISSLNKELSSKQEEHDSTILERKKWVNYEEKIEELQSKKNSYQVNVNLLQSTLDSCKEGTCPTCHKPFDSTDISSHEEDLKKAKEGLSSVATEMSLLREEKDKQDKEKKDREELSLRKNNLASQISSLKEKIDYTEKAFEDKLQNAKKAFEDTIQSKKDLLQEKESNKESKKDSLEKTLSSLKADIESFNKSLAGKQSNLVELQKKEKELSKKIEDFEVADISDIEQQKVSLQKEIESQQEVDQFNKIAETKNQELEEEKIRDSFKKEALNKEKENLLQEIEYKTSARKILLKDFPNFIIQQTIQDVEDKMNSFVEKIHDKGLNLKLHGTATSLKFLCGENKDKLRDVRSTSGAEKFLISLGFTSIFNTELELNNIFLDEVDQAMNEENTKKLYEIIESLPFDQIFIITHNKVLQSALIEDGANSFKFVNGKVEV